MADKYPNITVPPKTNFGNLVAQCGPKKSGQTHYIVIGIAMVVMAILSFIAPATFIPPQPGHEKVLWGVAIGSGCLFSLLAGVLLLIPMFDKPQVVFGFENGLVERRGDTDRLISFSDIKRAQIFENYEHRFAPRTFNVRLDIQGQKTIFFSSALSGDSMDVIDHLRSQVSCKEVPFTP